MTLILRVNTLGRKLGDQVPAALGIMLFAYAVCARSHRLVPQDGFYDDGILLSNAHFILRGLWPYRDFYTNYPPGIFLTLAAVWKVFGVSAWAYRLLAVGLHLGIALMAGRLTGRIVGRRFSWLAAGLVSAWTIPLGLIPFAFLAGLLCAFVSIELLLLARASRTRGRYLSAGVALGLVGCFRHDLLVYLVAVIAVAWAQPRVVRQWLGYARPAGRELFWLLAGAIIPLALVWVPTVVLAGVRAPLRDLVIEQTVYVLPARTLPIPPLTTKDPTTHWPVFLVGRLESAVAMGFAGPVFGAVLLIGRRWLRVGSANAATLVGLLSIAAAPQMLRRADLFHSLFVVTPALVLASALAEAGCRRAPWLPLKLAMVFGSVWLLVRPVRQDFWPRRPLVTTGMDGSPERRSSHRTGFYEQDGGLAPNRRAMLDYVEHHTRPNDRVVFATDTHEWVMVNEVDLYFLSDRLPGTRYTQYDPNLVTRREVQEEMIASLEQHDVRIVVRSSLIQGHENQPGMMQGSTLLDEYLRTRFKPVESHGPYTILERVR